MDYKKFGMFSAIIAIAFIAFWLATKSSGATPPVMNGTNGVPAGISSLRTYLIGGLNQWVMTRSFSTNNPVLLFLAGGEGPGNTELAWLRHYNSGLEKVFTVVNWDQRGAGKSYGAYEKDTNISLQTYLSDTLELVDALRKEYRQEKIFLVGHGFGTILGILAARDHPEKFHAYVGISQIVYPYENDRIMYRNAVRLAKATGDTNSVQFLKDLGEPPYTGANYKQQYADLTRWINQYTPADQYRNDFMTNYMRIVLQATEYSSWERLNFRRFTYNIFETLYPEMNRIDLIKDAPLLKVPVFFISGKYDQSSHPELVERYVSRLNAPMKKIYIFTNSARDPLYEENVLFDRIMTRDVARLAK